MYWRGDLPHRRVPPELGAAVSGGRYSASAPRAHCVVNVDQRFVWPELDVIALDCGDPQLSRYSDVARVRGRLNELHALNAGRSFGARIAMRGIVQRVIALACMRQEEARMRLSLQYGGKTSQHDALQRMVHYVQAISTRRFRSPMPRPQRFCRPTTWPTGCARKPTAASPS